MTTELIWVNGKVSKLAETAANFEDRGHQFADGVYEVIRVYRGVPFTAVEHLERMMRSAAGIRLESPYSVDEILKEVNAVIKQSGLQDGMIYMQLTRGISPRNHVFPAVQKPTLYFYVRDLPPVPAPGTAVGSKLLTVEDERWKRCWIKAIALLPNVLAKNEAVDAGADEAAFVIDGKISECSASNVFVVNRGVLITAAIGQKVLPGITRALLLELADELGIPVVEREPTLYEARNSEELFITSTTRELSWVSHIDGVEVHDTPGEVTMRLHRAYQERVRRACGVAAFATV